MSGSGPVFCPPEGVQAAVSPWERSGSDEWSTSTASYSKRGGQCGAHNHTNFKML